MDRRHAKLTAMAIAATAFTGTFAFATLGGMSILGLGATHRPTGAAAGQVVADNGPLPSDAAAVSAPVDSTGTPITPILIDTPAGPIGVTSGATPVGSRPPGAFGQQPVTPKATTPSGNSPTVTAQLSTAQLSTAQLSTAQLSTAQLSTAQLSTAQPIPSARHRVR